MNGAGLLDTVFFDLDDTIYDQAIPFAYAVRSVAGDAVGASAEELYDASRAHSAEIFAAYEAGRTPTVDEFARRMESTLADFGITITRDEAVEMQRRYASKSADAMVVSPVMQKVLDLCSKHAQLGIITNGRTRMQFSKVEVLGLSRWIPDENVFVSEKLGFAKPSEKIFAFACERVGSVPEHCIYVGDSFHTDVTGSLGAGMKALWLNRRHRKKPADGPSPTWEVQSEEGLLDVLSRVFA